MENSRRRIKEWSKTAVGRMIFGAGLQGVLFANIAVVVAFHRVSNETVGDGLTCGVELFRSYCRLFAERFRVVRLRDVIDKMEKGVPLNGELAITFDDGYLDNVKNAAPVLKDLGLPATFFVVSQFINTDYMPWWDRRTGVQHRWMTWDHVRWLCDEGFEIGAHTRTHVDLRELLGNEAQEEILGSRFELEEKLSSQVDLFAYPYGGPSDMAEENRDLVKAAGFRCCCSCYGGVNGTGTDPFYVRRVPIASWHKSAYEFGCDLALRRI